MKCTWTAESSRMKGSVQLGLLWLSLLISSVHGEVQTDSSKEIPVNFEDPSSSSFSLHQPEMQRVRRQTTEKEDAAITEVVALQSEKVEIRRKRPHPGAFTVLKVKPSELKVYRTKRQEKSKKRPRKKHPGYNSFLAMVPPPQLPQQPARAKRDERAGGKRPWPGS